MSGEAVDASRNLHLFREATTMVLYLSIVLLATLIALPTGDEATGADGVHGMRLIAIIWGTSLGLALAHWFAFRLTAQLYGGGNVSDLDVKIGFAQLAGAAFVAAVCTIPVLIASETDDVAAASWAPALILGVVGYLIARSANRSPLQSAITAVTAMILGLIIAAVKNFLLGH